MSALREKIISKSFLSFQTIVCIYIFWCTFLTFKNILKNLLLRFFPCGSWNWTHGLLCNIVSLCHQLECRKEHCIELEWHCTLVHCTTISPDHEEAGLQGHLCLHTEFEASMKHTRHYLENTRTNKTTKTRPPIFPPNKLKPNNKSKQNNACIEKISYQFGTGDISLHLIPHT